MQELSRRVLARLEAVRPGDHHVVALPDFFLDHIVAAPPWPEAVALMEGVHGRGGGNVPGWHQRLAPGGNATNTALALARLGVRAHLVCRTDAFGAAYLRATVGPHGVDLRQVSDDGELAVTTALEFGPERRNVMLSYAGSVADFGPEDLDDNQLTLIEGCDAVLLANWTANRASGTRLMEALLKVAAKGSALTYLDTGDPSARAAEVPELRRRVFASPDLDVLAVNENELRLYAGSADLDAGARLLAEGLTAQVDVHTAAESATRGPRGEARVAAGRVVPRRATGAGDVWNAGNLLGYLADLAPDERLHFANLVAGLYIAGEDGLPPTMGEAVVALRGA